MAADMAVDTVEGIRDNKGRDMANREIKGRGMEKGKVGTTPKEKAKAALA